MLIVILKHTQNILKLCFGDEDNSRPVMNHPARTRYGLAVVADFQLLHLHFAAFQRCISLLSLLFRQAVDPQEAAVALQFCFIPRVRQLHVMFESFLRFRFQLWQGRLSRVNDCCNHARRQQK